MSHARKSKLDRIALLGLLLCCSLWGLNQVAAKAGLSEIGPLWAAGLRSLGAALLVWAWASWRGIALFKRDGTFRDVSGFRSVVFNALLHRSISQQRFRSLLLSLSFRDTGRPE